MADNCGWRFNWSSDFLVDRINSIFRVQHDYTRTGDETYVASWSCGYCKAKTPYKLGHLESSVLLHLKEKHWNIFFELLVTGVIRSDDLS